MKNNKAETVKVANKGKYLLLLLVSAGVLAYCNSLSGPFIFDDEDSIPGNTYIRELWPPQYLLSAPPESTVAGRPIVSLTLALNYAFCGYRVWGYHAVNLAIHILAGLVLYGVVRRTLLSGRLKKRFGRHASALAWAVATIWLVHPIQTESVTYIIQRTESLMGLFYLLTLYAAMRAMDSKRVVGWSVLSVLCCGLGMATKEVMVTAPVLVLFYDRCFAAGSFSSAFRRRRGLYAGLAATWIILAGLMLSVPRSESVGFSVGAGPLDYALNQCIMIVRYVKLVFWPYPLVLDYGELRAAPLVLMLPYAVVLAVLLIVVIVTFFYRPMTGFPGAWFFVILAPTSSFVPIATEVGAERRMYLPLAALVAFLVLSGYVLLRNAAKRVGSVRVVNYPGVIVVLVVAGFLTVLTLERNKDYHSAISVWQSSVEALPDNPRAHFNLGELLQYQGRLDDAVARYRRTIELAPDFVQAYSNLGVVLQLQGKFSEGIDCFYQALKIKPDNPDVHYNLGLALRSQGRLDEAVRHFRRAVELAPDDAQARLHLGITMRLKEKTNKQ